MSRDSYTVEEMHEKVCLKEAPSGQHCVGDTCAAWNWSHSHQTHAHSQEVIRRCKAKIKNGDKSVDWLKEHNALLTEIKTGKHKGFGELEGYCGLKCNPHK